MQTAIFSSQDWQAGRRFRAWTLKQQGWKQRAIAQALGVTESAVSQWIRRGRTDGVESLRRVPHPGGPSKLRSYQQLALLEMLSMGAEVFGFRGAVWTGPRVVALVRHFLGISYHPGHMSRLLRRWGWSVQKPVRQAQQRDEAVIAQWPKQTRPQLKKKRQPKSVPSSV